MKMAVLFNCLFILFGNLSVVYSQFTGYGNDQRFQSGVRAPVIESFPPIYLNMPANTKFAFQYWFQQNNNYNSEYLWDFYRNASIEELRKHSSALFAIKNYDPLLIRSILMQTYFGKSLTTL